MTYGCRLWYKKHGSKKLVEMPQRVHNGMVKVT